MTPCSDMGFCDPMTGTCSCRAGYGGRACERLACPTKSYKRNVIPGFTVYDSVTGLPNVVGVNNDPTALPCSGHGRCRTIREIGLEFNGLTLVRPPVNYDGWEADYVTGCVCDEGYEGFDCSLRSCPKGRDPLIALSLQPETFILQCKAVAGYFSIKVLGSYTFPLPYDADPGLLQYALESLGSTVGRVLVSMTHSTPTVCLSTQVQTTKIVFLNYSTASMPPIFLTSNVSKTRQWPEADQMLSLSSTSYLKPKLRMATRYELTCEPCVYICQGYLFFMYRESMSSAISLPSATTSSVKAAILSLSALINEGWTNLDIAINVTSSTGDYVCVVGSTVTMEISIYSDYGNLPNDLRIAFDKSDNRQLNLTSLNKGSDVLYECSNQGFCDHITGFCSCLQYNSGSIKVEGVEYVSTDEKSYLAASSDGEGNIGTRGDCGLVSQLPSCYIDGRDACNGHGVCSNLTSSCACYDGWSGLTCQVATCPLVSLLSMSRRHLNRV